MKISRYGLSPDEDEDTTRHNYAKGSLLLRGLADTMSSLFHEGCPVAEHELRQLHADLQAVWRILASETLDTIGPDSHLAGVDALETFLGHYSDGTPVIGTEDVETREPQFGDVPAHFREPVISPDVRAALGDGGCVDFDDSAGVLVLEPPHFRASEVRNQGAEIGA